MLIPLAKPTTGAGSGDRGTQSDSPISWLAASDFNATVRYDIADMNFLVLTIGGGPPPDCREEHLFHDQLPSRVVGCSASPDWDGFGLRPTPARQPVGSFHPIPQVPTPTRAADPGDASRQEHRSSCYRAGLDAGSAPCRKRTWP
jgi:hypothetical protein